MWKGVEKRLAALNGVEQSAAKGGKRRQLPVTKGVISRQVRCRLWPLFAAPVLRACFDLYHRKEMVSIRKQGFHGVRFITFCRSA
jgi:hypothetical protein